MHPPTPSNSPHNRDGISPDLSDFFAAEWTRAQPAVKGYILSILRQPQDVEDVMQEVAVTACKDIHRFDRSRKFLPWVLSIARFRAIDYQRRQGRGKVVFGTDILESIELAAVEMSDGDAARLHLLKKCVGKLKAANPRAARVVQLRYEDSLSINEISSHVSKSPNAVRITLHRSRTALLTCMQRLMKAEGLDA